MSELKLDSQQKKDAIEKIKRYFLHNLDQDIGQFDAEFLLDFFSSEIGSFFYNKGLQDAGVLVSEKLEDLQHALYEVEKPVSF
ncbi:DUF2164 domain-containing protein [Oceaniserpentilla sp. 4NH20-0058]|uniref:DUF2164 domain-containing protein n=1 Tax=Oceaniserpentilla sp. 4NH20-0058 TaxID=3127660 RepID=UPI0031034758